MPGLSRSNSGSSRATCCPSKPMTQNVTVSRESRFSVQPGSSTTSRHADAHQRIHAPVAGAKRRGGIGLARCMLAVHPQGLQVRPLRSEEHTSELQSLMRISYAVFCLKKKNQ